MFAFLRRCALVAWDAYWRFTYNDGWAIASHVALAALLALFPFLIFVTALASFIGTSDLADQVVQLLFAAWPAVVKVPVESEVHNVLTGQRRDLLTIGGALMVWFSSSGVEAVRIGLNRAYGVKETRWWWQTRAQSILFIFLAAFAFLTLAFLIVLAPAGFSTAQSLFPEFASRIDEFRQQVLAQRYFVTTVILLAALFAVHIWLPNGTRRVRDVLPGILVTLVFWVVAASLFAYYLAGFANYATTYAGFGAAMAALVFLYFIAVIFILGGELNSAWQRSKKAELPPPEPTLLPIDG